MPFIVPDATGPLKPGETLPDFALKVATREGAHDFHMKDIAGRRVVFSFFPMAFTRTCTAQMCEMRDEFADLAVLDVEVYGFSTDTVAANRAYAKEHDLPYGILSDPNYDVVPRIWRLATVAGVEHRAMRGVMIIGPEGLVEWTAFNENASEWIGLDAVKARLEELG